MDVYDPIRRPNFNTWRWMGHDEVGEWQAAARASYVVRPYYPRLGLLDDLLTPTRGDLTVGTGLIVRHIPVPRVLLPYPRTRNQAVRGLVLLLNGRLPIVVKRLQSFGTVAIVDKGRQLPSIDVLPEPMRWEERLRLERRRALPWLSKGFGRERNLPSGVDLKPVRLFRPDQAYFAPLAADPVEAAAVLSPALLDYTRELGVAWWSDGSILFVWMHDAMPVRDRPQLAECAQRIYRLLTSGGRSSPTSKRS